MNYNIVVLGAGESGTGAAILAKSKGFDVLVSDYSKISDKYKTELNSHDIKWEEGHHSLDLILKAREIIKSPGIPDTIPLLQKATEKNIKIISEIEFASRYTQAKMIAITGSNGKTTTASLIYHLFKKANLNVGLAGNIGFSLARQVAQSNHEYYILELSSFQLDNMYQFKADIAILLNITPDHLDRYGYVFQNYINSKLRITQNQTPEDKFIFWADDPVITKELAKRTLKGTMFPFSLEAKKESLPHLTIADSQYIFVDDYKLKISRQFSKLAGKHNLYNTMSAVITAYLTGIQPEIIEEGLETFTGVEHRLEFVKTINDVEYINDSKATNVDSCYYALQAMTKPTVLILGGKDKGNDYDQIKELIKEKCKALVFLGADNQKLKDYFKNFNIPTVDTDSMDKAVEEAQKITSPGDVVLLSPCCASFDLFNSYEHRGELFKNKINQMA